MRTWEKILEAEDEDVIIQGLIRPGLRVGVPDSSTLASVTAEIESDAGGEALPLVETDAWLDGAATITSLPKSDAVLSLTLYDTGSAALMTFTGTLGADGSVSLAAERAKADIELLAAEVFTAEKGYDLGVGLAGADTYSVAYATITVTEGGAICVATDEKGNCLKWESTKEVSTRSEVYRDDVGSVWEADSALTHEGLVQVKVKTWDAEGNTLETTKSKLGLPWLDDGEGVGVLSTEEDPLTTIALMQRATSAAAISSVSEGWTVGDEVPVAAELALTDGETITVPVNSYQRPAVKLDVVGYSFDKRVLSAKARIAVVGDDMALDGLSLEELRTPACTKSTCVVLVENEAGEIALSATRYGAAAGALPDTETFTIAVKDELGDERWTVDIVYADELTAVFSNEVRFVGDPVGLGLSGKVSLLGAASRKGKQQTLAKGSFYAELTRDGDGELELGGGDKDEVVSSGSAVVSGEAVRLTDDEGNPDAPPVVVYGVMGNGSGTKNASSQVSARPQLL